MQTDDDNIDITVDSGSSLGLKFETATGAVRRDAALETADRLGSATGETSSALEYLRAAPVGDGLKNALASWQSQGARCRRSVAVDSA